MNDHTASVVCVMGLGYIGLPTAAMFATHGKKVIGVDISERVVETLRAGNIHIEEPGLEAIVRDAVSTGALQVQTQPAEADVFILAVPTPCRDDHAPDMRFVESAARAIAPHLRRGNLVVLESTSPPGTTLSLIPILEESGLKVGEDILLAHSPERVLPGRILTELRENDRVIGGHTHEAAAAGAELYGTFVVGEIHLTDATTAEMAKLMENTFRDVNIALANEFSRIGARVSIDIHEAIGLANHHPRVNILTPGPGVGGHCIAVDPWFIVDAAPGESTLIRTAREINDAQPEYLVKLIERALAGIDRPVIALLGMAYKADVDDVRESPAVDVANALAARGYELRLHDAYAHALPDGTPIERDLTSTVDGADAMVILTDHREYRELEPADETLCGMRHRILVDARYCLHGDAWRKAGYDVHQLGVGKPAARAMEAVAS